MAARALPLEPGDIVLVSDKEFPANVYPWMRLGDRGATHGAGADDAGGVARRGAAARAAEGSPGAGARGVAGAVQQRLPGGPRAALRRDPGDRAPTWWWTRFRGVGQLPVDVSRVQVDVLACGGQKWLLSPWGSGFVYVRRELIARLDPAITGWLAFEGTDDLSRLTSYNDMLRADARRFELMTLPYQDFAGLNSSLDLLLELGIERIRDHIRALHQPVLAWAEPDRRTSNIASRPERVGHPLRFASRSEGGPPPAERLPDHLQPAGGRDPPQSSLLQHGGGNGAGGADAGRGLTVRVAWLTALFPVLSEIPFLNQIIGLLERGHEVDIYADSPQAGGAFPPGRCAAGPAVAYPLSDPLAGGPAGTVASGGATAGGHRGRERRILLRTLDPSVFWHRAWTLDQLRRTARFLPVRPYDVCYCAFGMDAPHALRLRRLGVLGGELVVAFRGADTTKYVARRGPRVYARTFREARLLLPVCEFLGRRLVGLGAPAERVVVHPTGIDLRRWPYPGAARRWRRRPS